MNDSWPSRISLGLGNSTLNFLLPTLYWPLANGGGVLNSQPCSVLEDAGRTMKNTGKVHNPVDWLRASAQLDLLWPLRVLMSRTRRSAPSAEFSDAKVLHVVTRSMAAIPVGFTEVSAWSRATKYRFHDPDTT